MSEQRQWHEVVIGYDWNAIDALTREQKMQAAREIIAKFRGFPEEAYASNETATLHKVTELFYVMEVLLRELEATA